MTMALATVATVTGLDIVPAQRTPLAPLEAAGRLSAYPEVNRTSGPLLMALIWVETAGNPTAYNVGNITASERYNGQAWRPPWFTVGPNSSDKMKRLNARMRAGTAPKAFRAYSNFAEAFDDFMVQMNRSFPEVLAAANTGDARAFVDALSLKYSKDYGPSHYPAFSHHQTRFSPLFSNLPASHRLSHRGTSGGSELGALVFFGLLFAAASGAF